MCYGTTVRRFLGSLAPASGQEFALLSPDNATGNFPKIVQRIPVKIRVDKKDPLAGLLRPGMSVEPTIDTDHPGRALVQEGCTLGWGLRPEDRPGGWITQRGAVHTRHAPVLRSDQARADSCRGVRPMNRRKVLLNKHRLTESELHGDLVSESVLRSSKALVPVYALRCVVTIRRHAERLLEGAVAALYRAGEERLWHCADAAQRYQDRRDAPRCTRRATLLCQSARPPRAHRPTSRSAFC